MGVGLRIWHFCTPTRFLEKIFAKIWFPRHSHSITMLGQLNQIFLYLFFSIHQVIYLWRLYSKKKKNCSSIPRRRPILDIVDMSQNAIFHFFFIIFLHIVYDNRFVSARKSPWAVPFGSDTSLKSELGYRCLIFRVIDHYGQFQNDRRKIHDLSWNVLSNKLVFLHYTWQSQFWYLIVHFNARLRIYKCCKDIFTTESKMAARKWWNAQNFKMLKIFFCK